MKPLVDQKTTVEIYGRNFEIRVVRKSRGPREGVTIVMPCHNGLRLTRLAVECLRKFTPEPHELWIIDNASDSETVEWLLQQDDLNVILNLTGTHNTKKSDSSDQEWWKEQYGGSYANAVGLELGSFVCESRWMFVMHNDAIPCAPYWITSMLAKTSEKIRGVAFRQDHCRVFAMHQSGMLFDHDLFKTIHGTFKPSLPEVDVADAVTVDFQKNGYQCYYFKNTFNKHEVEFSGDGSYQWLDKIYCDKAVDDFGRPIYLHLGRGTLQTSKPGVKRETTVDDWYTAISENLLNWANGIERPCLRHRNYWLKSRGHTLRRWHVDRFGFRFIGCYPPKTKALDIGGHKGKQQGEFDIQSYGFDRICFNITDSKGTDVLGDAIHLPFLNETMDLVVMSEVLEHIPDPRDVLNEVFRVLKPGGRATITIPFMYRIHGDPEDYGRYTEWYWKKYLPPIGFEIKHLQRQGRFFTVIFDSIRHALMISGPNPKSWKGKVLDWVFLKIIFKIFVWESKEDKSFQAFYSSFTSGFEIVVEKPFLK